MAMQIAGSLNSVPMNGLQTDSEQRGCVSLKVVTLLDKTKVKFVAFV
jgi:hypothetical protein